MILDSGERREFDSGAVRDVQEGKGRCDLLPLGLFNDRILKYIDHFVRKGETEDIVNAVSHFSDKLAWDFPTMMIEVAIHYEEGCNKYGARNWEKGIPCHCYIDSGVRHYLKWLRGDGDERHDRAFLWNMLCLLWTVENRPEMIDLPYALGDERDD